jgi:ATPase subunit of ABC transporter with duplicated ATPase domains
VGLGYITLDRLSRTLSGGELRRIEIANALGSGLVDSLYVLDEPTTGLHARDSERLVSVLKHLSGAGNTVVVVEHDREVVRSADWAVDLGPRAGSKLGWGSGLPGRHTGSARMRELADGALPQREGESAAAEEAAKTGSSQDRRERRARA